MKITHFTVDFFASARNPRRLFLRKPNDNTKIARGMKIALCVRRQTDPQKRSERQLQVFQLMGSNCPVLFLINQRRS